MENVSLSLNILIYTSSILVIALIVLCVFLVNFIFKLAHLTKNLDEMTTLIKQDLEPTLVELRLTLQNLNAIAGTTNRQIENVKNILGRVSGLATLIFNPFRSLSGGFLKGLSVGMRLFGGKSK